MQGSGSGGVSLFGEILCPAPFAGFCATSQSPNRPCCGVPFQRVLSCLLDVLDVLGCASIVTWVGSAGGVGMGARLPAP